MKVTKHLARAVLAAVVHGEYITEENYDATIKGRAVLLQFTITLEGCTVCGQTQPKWEKLSQRFGSSQEVAVGWVGRLRAQMPTSKRYLCSVGGL